MPLRDLRSSAPFRANNEPARIGENVPDDLSKLKRGSVAVIIRFRGDKQEILLIKRSARHGDRWSGHIALPGGRQNPGESDYETAVRETREEVGLDLTNCAQYLGPLEPRLVRVSWGRHIAMVLCPFIFAMHDGLHDVFLTPQESEVAAVFWHPLALLYNSEYRTKEIVPIANRININGIVGDLVRHQAGDMKFDAVNIWPKNCSIGSQDKSHLPEPPWKMWGITWGIMQDVRRLVDPDMSIDNIKLPRFSAVDLNFILTLVSSLPLWKQRKAIERAPPQADWTNKLLVQHFKYFPIVIGLGLLGRLAAVLYLMKRAYRFGRR